MADERPGHRDIIHGHPVYCDDYDVRQYLRQLDSSEARAIFEYARNHGRTDFEMKKGGTRYNCAMEYDDGAYIVMNEGRQETGWF